ncbi:MAG: tetratricopeptide repeat protein [Bacteroidetes bacterium]|nr:tetratricopeptide repeat protein [Bacteroidota bacterium]
MRLAFAIILFLFSVSVKSQDKIIDSLLNVLSISKDDTTGSKILLEIARKYYETTDYKNSEFYLGQSYLLAKRLNYQEGIIDYYFVDGRLLKNNGKYFEAKLQYEQALALSEKINDSGRIASSYNHIGNLYVTIHENKLAFENLQKSANIFKAIKDYKKLAYPLSNIGKVYMDMEQYDSAMYYYNQTIELAKRYSDNYELAQSYKRIASIYAALGNYATAFRFCDTTLRLSALHQYRYIIADVYEIQAKIFLEKKDYKNSKINLKKSLDMYQDLKVKPSIRYSYLQLSKLDSLEGNYKDAYHHFKLYHAYNDSVVDIEYRINIEKNQMQYDFVKKEAVTKAEQDKKQALASAEIQKQKIIRNFSLAGIFVVLLIGGYGFYRYRKNKEIENQQLLLNERLRISRELHDDMGSTLSSISVYSEVAKNRAAKNGNETEVLQKIGAASRELIEKMSDIVWSLNPNNENFEQLKNRMMAFAAMMLTPKGILFEFDIDNEEKSTTIAPVHRKNIFLIYKEAINNIVKYSEASTVQVIAKVKENKLCLEILDNGIGFDTDNVVAYNGNGLKNMKARAEEIKARFYVTSSLNEGVKIELTVSI